MKKVNVIRHLAFEDLGNVAPVLEGFGAEIKYYEAGLHDIDSSIDDCDLLVILGGPIGVYDDEDFPFLTQEIELIQQRINSKRPILGVCLGAQLIARAMGAKVYPGHTKEIGWGYLQLASVADNPLANLQDQAILHWHGDTFDLPESATLLASNENYPNQAYAIGNFCLAVQFHLEVTTKGMERWYIGHIAEISVTKDVDVPSLRLGTRENGDKLQPKAEKIWKDWLQNLGW